VSYAVGVTGKTSLWHLKWPIKQRKISQKPPGNLLLKWRKVNKKLGNQSSPGKQVLNWTKKEKPLGSFGSLKYIYTCTMLDLSAVSLESTADDNVH